MEKIPFLFIISLIPLQLYSFSGENISKQFAIISQDKNDLILTANVQIKAEENDDTNFIALAPNLDLRYAFSNKHAVTFGVSYDLFDQNSTIDHRGSIDLAYIYTYRFKNLNASCSPNARIPLIKHHLDLQEGVYIKTDDWYHGGLSLLFTSNESSLKRIPAWWNAGIRYDTTFPTETNPWNPGIISLSGNFILGISDTIIHDPAEPDKQTKHYKFFMSAGTTVNFNLSYPTASITMGGNPPVSALANFEFLWPCKNGYFGAYIGESLWPFALGFVGGKGLYIASYISFVYTYFTKQTHW
jgi:hypothetical protein